MKRLFLLACAILFCILMAGCNNSTSESTPSPSPKVTATFTGLVGEITSPALTMVNRQGQEFRFTTTLTEEDTMALLIPGATLTICYSGELEGTNPPLLLEAEVAPSFLPRGMQPGRFSSQAAKAYQKFCTMTPEERLGQVFLIKNPRTPEDLLYSAPVLERDPEADDKAPTPADTLDYSPLDGIPAGGAWLGKEFFADLSKKEVRAKTAAFKEGEGIPPLLAVQETGGADSPVSSNRKLSSGFASPRTIWQKNGLLGIRNDGEKKAALLKNLGITVNLGPIVDLVYDPASPLYEYALGQTGGEAAESTAAMVAAYREAGVGCALAHFPGLGNTYGVEGKLLLDQRPYRTFVQEDLLPFQAGIEADAPCVLLSSAIVPCMDKNRPASFSPAVHTLLRENLSFSGVILTDDLNALTGGTAGVHPAVEALQGSGDLLMVSDYPAALGAVYDALQNQTLSQEQIDTACFRVLCWKGELGLLS